jgi:hypothetical protein
VPKTLVFPTAGNAVAAIGAVGWVELLDLTTIYPVGAVVAAVKLPEIVDKVLEVELAVAANDVGVMQGGGGVNENVIPVAGFVVIDVVFVEELTVAAVVTFVPRER